MACAESPEGGFHRYQLAPQGDTRDYTTRCVYCGQEKAVSPTEPNRSRWERTADARQRHALTAAEATRAAKRRQSEA